MQIHSKLSAINSAAHKSCYKESHSPTREGSTQEALMIPYPTIRPAQVQKPFLINILSIAIRKDLQSQAGLFT